MAKLPEGVSIHLFPSTRLANRLYLRLRQT